MIVHPISPLFDSDSKVLILGSFPSIKSREAMFFYGHKQNHFWKVVAKVFDEQEPITVEEKKDLILRHHLALWDTIGSCEITGSADSTITNVVANDLSVILNHCSIERIYCNGNKSYELYMKLIYPKNHIEATKLPSTSPANASFSLDKLLADWQQIKID